jgi:hypothetical protein
MKFLTMSTIKESYYSLSPTEQAKIMSLSLQYILDLKKKMGSHFAFYYTPAMTYQISVGEYSSLEEYSQSLMSPAAQAGFMEYESYPLIEIDEKSIQGYMANLKPGK